MNRMLMLAGVLAGSLAVTPAMADTLQITNVQNAYSNAPETDIRNHGDRYNDVRVTPFNVTGTFNGDAISLFTYCVDIAETIGTGTFQVVSLADYLNDTAKFNTIASIISSNLTPGGKTNDAAVQAALWETMFESSNNLDVTKNAFTLSGGINSTLANSILADAVNGTINPNLNLFVAQSEGYYTGYGKHKTWNPGKQDLLFWNVSAPAVPEPATWAMMIIGMGAVGASLRRRSTKVQFV